MKQGFKGLVKPDIKYPPPIEYTTRRFSHLSCMSSTINTNLLVGQMKLWCIVEGAEDPSGVQVNDNDDVVDLKKAIKAQCSPIFDNIYVGSIKIWRISKSLHEARQLTVANLGEEAMVSVGEYWPDLTADVHVFISNPLGGSTV